MIWLKMISVVGVLSLSACGSPSTRQNAEADVAYAAMAEAAEANARAEALEARVEDLESQASSIRDLEAQVAYQDSRIEQAERRLRSMPY